MKVFVTGGTGFVGSLLIKKLLEEGFNVTVLKRGRKPAKHLPLEVNIVEGEPTEYGEWRESAKEHDVAINLAGASIFTIWTEKAKKLIRDSRMMTTKNLVKAISSQGSKTSLLISTSAVGYYGPYGDESIDEKHPAGDDFLASVTKEWEWEAGKAKNAGIRVVINRFGIVMGASGGALKKMLPAFKLHMGNPLGSGEQWFPWIHESDLMNIHLFEIRNKDIEGPVNCTAPNSVRNSEFTKALKRALGKPSFMPPVPGFIVKTILGEMGAVLLEGQKAIPSKLMEHNFSFLYPDIDRALNNLTKNSI